MTESTEYVLRRDGDAPVRFRGRQVAESTPGSADPGRRAGRWHELALYETEGGQYVLEIRYNSTWEREAAWSDVLLLPDISAVRKELLDYDPAERVVGYPLGDQYVEKQKRLLADIERRYDAQVADLLDGFPVDVH